MLSRRNGDHLDIDFTPTNYTPDATPAEAADVDDLAAHLAGIDTAERAPDDAYEPAAVAGIYDEMLRRAAVESGERNGPVLLDATFQSAAQRRNALAAAAEQHARVLIVHVTVDDRPVSASRPL